jgi:hypothetical protein
MRACVRACVRARAQCRARTPARPLGGTRRARQSAPTIALSRLSLALALAWVTLRLQYCTVSSMSLDCFCFSPSRARSGLMGFRTSAPLQLCLSSFLWWVLSSSRSRQLLGWRALSLGLALVLEEQDARRRRPEHDHAGDQQPTRDEQVATLAPTQEPHRRHGSSCQRPRTRAALVEE